jgi:RNA polymerase sigma-70 factor (ECF subfamily)
MNPTSAWPMTATVAGIGQRSQRGSAYGEPPDGSRASICPTPGRGALPRRLDTEDRRWVEGLVGRGVRHERTCRDLHAILLRAARFEVAQRRGTHQVGGVDLEDIACQAASDALLLVIRKAGEFRGESAFTTWAKRFVGFEVRAKLRQHSARQRTVEIGPEHSEQLVEVNADPSVHAEARELVEAVRGVVNDRFSAHQRTVFAALLGSDLSPADVGLQMGLTANAVYQIAFRARHCLRGQLRAGGFLE